MSRRDLLKIALAATDIPLLPIPISPPIDSYQVGFIPRVVPEGPLELAALLVWAIEDCSISIHCRAKALAPPAALCGSVTNMRTSSFLHVNFKDNPVPPKDTGDLWVDWSGTEPVVDFFYRDANGNRFRTEFHR